MYFVKSGHVELSPKQIKIMEGLIKGADLRIWDN